MYRYLAIPYTGHEVESFRYSLHALTVCFERDLACYSPIIQWHPVHVSAKIPPDYEHFALQNEALIEGSTGLDILVPPGWEDLVLKSKGVAAELKLAESLHLDNFVFTLNADGINIHPESKSLKERILCL